MNVVIKLNLNIMLFSFEIMLDQINKLKAYINNIKEKDKIAIIYHGFCCDGVCSAVITSRSLERILKRKVDFHVHNPSHEITQEIFDFLIKNKVKKLLFVDMFPYKPVELYEKTEKNCNILIIDHHPYNKDINSEKTTFIHSTFINKDIPSHHYPASKLTFDLFSKLINIDDIDYLSCFGLISDASSKQWKDFLNETLKKYNFEVNDDIFKTVFGTGSTNIQLSKRFKDNIEEVFDVIYNSNKPEDIINSKNLLKYKNKINDEIQYWINKREKSERHGNLIIYKIKSEFSIGTTVATVLSFDYFPGKTLVVIREDDNDEFFTISARDQKINIKVNILLEKAAEGIEDANVGGHEPAAGGRIKKEYYEKFKKNLIEAYKKLSPK